MARRVQCLIISNTQDNAFPYIAAKVDVALQCGDVKPFIAGNHTVCLDPKWWSDNVVALPCAAIAQFRPTVNTGESLMGRGSFAGPE